MEDAMLSDFFAGYMVLLDGHLFDKYWRFSLKTISCQFKSGFFIDFPNTTVKHIFHENWVALFKLILLLLIDTHKIELYRIFQQCRFSVSLFQNQSS